MTQMKWHEVIKHMAEQGFESVEGTSYNALWSIATISWNPCTAPSAEWRIKPATLKINVEIPKPDCAPDEGWPLLIGTYVSKADRDEAQRILVAALRGESS